jgi:hypothetical protein
MVLAHSVCIVTEEIEATCPDSQKPCPDSNSRECMFEDMSGHPESRSGHQLQEAPIL